MKKVGGKNGVKSGSISKKQNKKPLSKKKQNALSKSSKVMIEKMNNHTTDDDIANIIMSVESHTDTKAVEDSNEDEDRLESAKKSIGLRSFKSDQLKSDQAKDVVTAEKEKAVQNDIAEQLKLIDSFSL